MVEGDRCKDVILERVTEKHKLAVSDNYRKENETLLTYLYTTSSRVSVAIRRHLLSFSKREIC